MAVFRLRILLGGRVVRVQCLKNRSLRCFSEVHSSALRVLYFLSVVQCHFQLVATPFSRVVADICWTNRSYCEKCRFTNDGHFFSFRFFMFFKHGEHISSPCSSGAIIY